MSVPRLRVAFVAPSLRILGGQAVQADRLLQAWRADPDVEAWLVPVNPLPPPPLRAAVGIKYLRTMATEMTYLPLLIRELSKADVVHVFSASYSSFLLAPLPAIGVAKLLGKPVVLNYRSGEAGDHLRRSAVARAALARVDRNVVPSRYLVDVFGAFGIDASIVPNIVDPQQFAFRHRDRLRPRLVSTRNFEALYDVETTLRAFRVVQDRWPDASLTLVGGGSREPALKALVERLQLRNVVWAGRVPPDQIARHYADNDIYIQSPSVDNMPTSVIEAFASGLPVVSTNAGGVPAIVTDGRTGLLAPTGDAGALAARVLDLLSNPERARAIARAAFESSRSCTWPSVRDEWLRVYRSVLPRADRSMAAQAAVTHHHDAA